MNAAGNGCECSAAAMAYRKLPRGFTLVEVLVALAIVVVGLAALFSTTNQTLRTSSYLREKTLAQWIALNRITETRASGTIPAGDQSEGEVEYAGATWRWELEKIQTPVKGIVRLEARVAQEDAPDDKWLAQATGFMGEAIAPPGSGPLNWLNDGNRTQRPGGQPPPGTPPPPGTTPPPGPGGEEPPVDPGQPQQ